MIYFFKAKLQSVFKIVAAGRKTITVLVVVTLSCCNFANAGDSVPTKSAAPEKHAVENIEQGKTVPHVNQSAVNPAVSETPQDIKATSKHPLKNEAGSKSAPEKSLQNKPVDAADNQKAPKFQNTQPVQPVQTCVKAPSTNQGQSNQDSKPDLKSAVGQVVNKLESGQNTSVPPSKVPLDGKAKIETKQAGLEMKPAKTDVKQSVDKSAQADKKDNNSQNIALETKNEAVKQIPNSNPAPNSSQTAKQKKSLPGQTALPGPNAPSTAQIQASQNTKVDVKPERIDTQGKSEPAQVKQPSSSATPNQDIGTNKIPHVPAKSTLVTGSNSGIATVPPQPSVVPPGPITPVVAPPIQTPAVPVRPPRNFPPQPRPQGKVTLNFDDADIYSVIQTVFGEILHVSYTVDPKIKGRVTFRAIGPVDIDKVLPLMEVIFRLNGIAVVEGSGLNRIVPLSDIAREPVPVSFGRAIETVTGKSILKVVPIKNMQSAEMVKLLTPFSSEKAVIVNVPNTNQIIIVDTDSTVKRLIQLIEIFDTELQKPRGARVYVHHIQNGSAKDITELLNRLFLGVSSGDRSRPRSTIPSPHILGMLPPKTPPVSGSITSGSSVVQGMDAVLEQARIVADENANTVIVYATPEEYEAIKDAIEKIDVTPRQVLIEALVLDVLLSDNLSLGVNAAYHSKNLRIGFNAASNAKTDDNVTPDAGIITKGLSILKLAGNSDLSLFITALAEKTKMKVLSAPHTIVSDSKEAEITIADTVQITSADIVGTTTVQNTTLYQQKDVGTILKVTPRIHEGGMVALKVSQEVSQVAGDISNVKQGTLFHKTQVKNELVAMDGETIVIGGLIREDSTRTRSGIPFLSSIPLLGWLFGGTTDNAQRRELIILLTPRVIKNQNDASRLTEEYINRLVHGTKTGLTKDDITKQLPVIKKGPDISQNRTDSKQQK